jgi:predicted MFS family arabinose efflux permease
MAPVLTPIATEFRISTGAAGLVVAAYGAPGILVAIVAGPYSDRFGRKRFLVAGSLIMGVSPCCAPSRPVSPS